MAINFEPNNPLAEEEILQDWDSKTSGATNLGKLRKKEKSRNGKIGFTKKGIRDDSDLYQFTLTEDLNNVNIVLDDLKANANITLFDEDGVSLKNSRKRGKKKEKINQILKVGTYYLEVTPQGNAKTKYQLSIDIDIDYNQDDNGTIPGQDLGKLGEDEINITDRIGFREGGFIDRNDYWQFELTEKTNVKLELDGLSRNATLELYDGDGSTLLYNSKNQGTTAEEIAETLDSGVYYARVKKMRSNKTEYSLSLSGTPVDYPESNPQTVNNDFFVNFAATEPDLVIKNLSAPSEANAGDEISMSATVQNIGSSMDKWDPFYIDYYLSDDTTFSYDDDIYLWADYSNGLKAGKSKKFSASEMIPEDTSGGTKYLLFVADPFEFTTESDETNNVAYQEIYIYPSIPDLVIKNPSAPSEADAGDEISISATIKNIGSNMETSDSIYLDYYLSDDTSFSSDDISLSSDEFSSLNARDSADLSTSVTIPEDTSEGTKYLLFVADPDELLTEISEDNNVAYQELYVSVEDDSSYNSGSYNSSLYDWGSSNDYSYNSGYGNSYDSGYYWDSYSGQALYGNSYDSGLYDWGSSNDYSYNSGYGNSYDSGYYWDSYSGQALYGGF